MSARFKPIPVVIGTQIHLKSELGDLEVGEIRRDRSVFYAVVAGDHLGRHKSIDAAQAEAVQYWKDRCSADAIGKSFLPRMENGTAVMFLYRNAYTIYAKSGFMDGRNLWFDREGRLKGREFNPAYSLQPNFASSPAAAAIA